MSLQDAHAIAEELERAIAAELDEVARVDTHLEPLESPAALGADVTERHEALVQWTCELAEQQPEVANCHEVVVTDTAEGLSMVMHCEAAPGLSVRQVHEASTRIEAEVQFAGGRVDPKPSEDGRAVGRRAKELREDLQFLTRADDPGHVYYLEIRGRGEAIAVALHGNVCAAAWNPAQNARNATIHERDPSSSSECAAYPSV